MSKPEARPKAKFQISLQFMLLLMVVFAIASAGLFYASHLPSVREEISVYFTGKSANAAEDVGRKAHMLFIMLTVTSPLLLAAVLSTGVSILRWRERR